MTSTSSIDYVEVSIVDAKCEVLEQFDRLTSARCEGATWQQLGLQLRLSLAVWLSFLMLLCVGRGVWLRKIQAMPRRRQWATYWLGTATRPPVDDRLEVSLCVLQCVCSSATVASWVTVSYERTVRPRTHILHTVCSVVFVAHILFDVTRRGLDPRLALSWEAALDTLTLPPLLLRDGVRLYNMRYRATWLNLTYFRVVPALRMFERFVETTTVQRNVSPSVAITAAKLVELVAVIVVLSATMLIVEALGDINSNLADSFFAADGGPVSFLQMCYFTFTTISTVGFGDFSPTTLLGRLVIIPAILLGVTFFSVSSAAILKIRTTEASGGGRYRPRGLLASRPRGHVVIVGGGLTCGSAALVEPFLEQLCRTERDDVPDIVLMSRVKCNEAVRGVLSQPKFRDQVRYLVGNPTNALDLDRARVAEADVAFVVADINATDPDREDRSNILTAVALKRASPKTSLRLMLLTQDKLSLAVSAGVDPLSCFAINEFKANLLLSSLIFPGFLTLVLNLGLKGLSTAQLQTQLPGCRPSDRQLSPWLQEYIEGTAFDVVGFLPAAILVGSTFQAAAIAAGKFDVTLLGAQLSGRIELNPACSSELITFDTILFAAANIQGEGLAKVARTWRPADWAEDFRRARSYRTLNASERSLFGLADTLRDGIDKPQDKRALMRSSKSAFGSRRWMTENRSRHLELYGFGTQPAREISPVVRRLQTRRSSLQSSLLRMADKTFDRLRVVGDEDPEPDSLEDAAALSSPDTDPTESLRSIIEQGDHVVIVIQGPGVWHQVAAVVATFRRTHTTAVVLVGAHRPPRALLETYERVFFVAGEPERASTLVRAGVVTCARLLTLLPNAPPADELERTDELALTVAVVVETQLANWERADLACVYDWCSLRTLQQLPQPAGSRAISIYASRRDSPPVALFRAVAARWRRVSVGSSDDESWWEFSRQAATMTGQLRGADSRYRVRPEPGLRRSISDLGDSDGGRSASRCKISDVDDLDTDCDDDDAMRMTRADLRCASLEPRTDCRFAAGRVLPKSEIAGMCAAAAFFPGIEEIMRGLVGGGRDQSTSIYMLAVDHSHVSRPYRDLAFKLLVRSAIPLGIMRRPAHSLLPYVVTCGPAYDGLLNHGDAVFVLADIGWDCETLEIPTPDLVKSARRISRVVDDQDMQGPGHQPNDQQPLPDDRSREQPARKKSKRRDVLLPPLQARKHDLPLDHFPQKSPATAHDSNSKPHDKRQLRFSDEQSSAAPPTTDNAPA